MMNLKDEISKAFNSQAAMYEKAAKIQNEIGSRLFERLDFLKIAPRYILDLGCGTGLFSLQLKKRYPQAQIISLDLAYNMLQETKKKQSFWRKWPLVNADMDSLPFADGLFDLIFANQTLHWSPTLRGIIKELNRVLHTQGCLMFTTLGPDTFKELKHTWEKIDPYAHTNIFTDMHDIGDYLLQENMINPVMDMEIITVSYRNLSDLIHAIKAQGVRNINSKRRIGLMGKLQWQAFCKAFTSQCAFDHQYPLTYEVIYGHAWKGVDPSSTQEIVYIPATAIVKRQNTTAEDDHHGISK